MKRKCKRLKVFFNGGNILIFRIELTVVDDEVSGLVVVGDVSKLRLESEHFLVPLQKSAPKSFERIVHHTQDAFIKEDCQRSARNVSHSRKETQLATEKDFKGRCLSIVQDSVLRRRT